MISDKTIRKELFPVHLLTFSLPVMWLIILVVLALAEAATINLVSIWFAAGALTALLVSLFCQNFWIQLVVFLLVSTLCLALVRPLAQKKFTPHLRPTNLDLLLGQYGVVTEDIDNEAGTGAVYVDGKTWTARSSDGSVIPIGTKVTVERMEGVKLFVTPERTPCGAK